MDAGTTIRPWIQVQLPGHGCRYNYHTMDTGTTTRPRPWMQVQLPGHGYRYNYQAMDTGTITRPWIQVQLPGHGYRYNYRAMDTGTTIRPWIQSGYWGKPRYGYNPVICVWVIGLVLLSLTSDHFRVRYTYNVARVLVHPK